jgi:hypothetical protein
MAPESLDFGNIIRNMPSLAQVVCQTRMASGFLEYKGDARYRETSIEAGIRRISGDLPQMRQGDR